MLTIQRAGRLGTFTFRCQPCLQTVSPKRSLKQSALLSRANSDCAECTVLIPAISGSSINPVLSVIHTVCHT